MSQQICSKSGVLAGHSQSTEDTSCHSDAAKPADASDDEASPSGTRRQKKAPPVTDGAQVEAAGHLTFTIKRLMTSGSISLPSNNDLRQYISQPSNSLPPLLSDPLRLNYPILVLAQTACFFHGKTLSACFRLTCGGGSTRWTVMSHAKGVTSASCFRAAD